MSVLSKSGIVYSKQDLIPTILARRSYATPIRYVNSETYTRKVLIDRSGTCYGLSAAVGKAGAAIGTQAFTPIQNNLGKR